MQLIDSFSNTQLKNANLLLGVIGVGGTIAGLVVTGPGGVATIVAVSSITTFGQVGITEILRQREGVDIDLGDRDFRMYALNQAINLGPAAAGQIGKAVSKLVSVTELADDIKTTVQLVGESAETVTGLGLSKIGVASNFIDVLNEYRSTGNIPEGNSIGSVSSVGSNSVFSFMKADSNSIIYNFTISNNIMNNFNEYVIQADPNTYQLQTKLQSGDGWGALESRYGSAIRNATDINGEAVYNKILNPGTSIIIPMTGVELAALQQSNQLRDGDKGVSQIGANGNLSYSTSYFGQDITPTSVAANNGITNIHEVNAGQKVVLFEKIAVANAFTSATNNGTLLQTGSFDPDASAGWVTNGYATFDPTKWVFTNPDLLNSYQPAGITLGMSLITDGWSPGNFGLAASVYAPQEFSLLPDYDFFQAVGLNAGLTRTYAPVDPLVLDLNGDGVRLTDYGSAPVLFDADNDGGSLENYANWRF